MLSSTDTLFKKDYTQSLNKVYFQLLWIIILFPASLMAPKTGRQSQHYISEENGEGPGASVFRVTAVTST